jgi:hypothetical protein
LLSDKSSRSGRVVFQLIKRDNKRMRWVDLEDLRWELSGVIRLSIDLLLGQRINGIR